MKNKFGISSRGTGKVNDKGKIEDYKLLSYDFTSLYPGIMPDLSEELKKELLRQSRLKKLKEIEKKSDKDE